MLKGGGGIFKKQSFQLLVVLWIIGVRGRRQGGGGGGQLPSQIRAKQWGKSGQSKKKKNKGKISGKSTPLSPLTEESPYAHALD